MDGPSIERCFEPDNVLALDGDLVLWAPDLDGLALSHAPAVNAALRAGGAATEASAALAAWLRAQGYPGGGEQPSVPSGTPGVVVSRVFDPAGWLQALQGDVRAFLYSGDGRRAFAYSWREGEDPCGRCLVRRWLTSLDDTPALRRAMAERVRFTPCAGLADLLDAARARPGVAHLLEAGRVRRVRFLPVPGCCPPPARCGARAWYGHPLALVKEVSRGAVRTARTGSTRPVLGGAAFPSGSGTSRWAAVGEALERYAAAWLPPDMTWETRAPAFPFADDAPYRRPRPGERIPWLPVRRVSPAKGTATLPAESVLLLREGLVPPPDPVPTLSHGLACGRSLRAAFTAALLEVLERDATARFWGRLLRGTSDAVRLAPDVLLAPALGGAPTAVAVLRDPSHGGFCLGAATRLTVAEAVAKARDEARHNLEVLRASPGTDPGDAPGDFTEHARFYWHRPEAFPLDAIGRLSDTARPPARTTLPAVLAELRRRGVEVLVRDLTPPDVRAAGFRVVRAHAPGLLSLPSDHRGWPTRAPRWVEEVGGGRPAAPHPFA